MTVNAETHSPTDAELMGMMRTMVAARIYSTRCFNLQRQGRLGTMAPINGNEAVVVGSTYALQPDHDWIFPQYREHYGLGRYGEEVIRRHVLYLAGHPEGGNYPVGLNVFPRADLPGGADPPRGRDGLGAQTAGPARRRRGVLR